MIDPGHPRLSIVRQCELTSISRSSFYREPTAETEATLRLMRLIDEQFLETPWYGSRQMARHLRRNGWCVGRHRVRRLMSKMGLARLNQLFGNSLRVSVMYLPQNTPRASICCGVSSGLNSGSKLRPTGAESS